MHRTASDDSDGRSNTDDLWINTIISVCGFLAGFGLASVVVIISAPEHFRWQGETILALTIASVVLAAVTVIARRKAGYRRWIWVPYHIGISALSLGLGLALAPSDDVGRQEGLRWAASGIAWLACAVELIFTVYWLRKELKNSGGNPQKAHS